MSIYSRKRAWKIWLIITGALIVTALLWYTNLMVKRVARDERNQVAIWAEAVKKRAALVRYTNTLFRELRESEEKKVELYAKGTRELGRQHDDYTFILEVISANKSIPVILADADSNILGAMNVDKKTANDQIALKALMRHMATLYKPIEIPVDNEVKQYVYYQNSKLFEELQYVMDDLIESFISDVVINSAMVPVIFTDESGTQVTGYGNIDTTRIASPEQLQETINEMAESNAPIPIDLGNHQTGYIYYENSFLLTQLQYYPYIIFSIIGLFILVGYWLFSQARKAEQNQVWVGMAKETAHQLGTPLSSLMAWLELFKERGLEKQTTGEIEKDLNRLNTITDRFSKIGSAPVLEPTDICTVMNDSITYMKSRSSEAIQFQMKAPDDSLFLALNTPLFQWVVENLFTNAINAMGNTGAINVAITDALQHVYIDISDTGKGIASGHFKRVFEPGFSTRDRGWGLGLSLAKRIIEIYHKGKIFVKSSEPGKGTTFRIVLNK